MTPVITETGPVATTIRRWAARPYDGEYFNPIRLTACSSLNPEECVLQGTCELHSGRSPERAVRSMALGMAVEELPEMTVVKQFNYVGPVAEINDLEAERDLLSKSLSSDFWPRLRELGERGALGIIRLRQLGRLLVPPHAFARSPASMDWFEEGEWTLSTELALAEIAGAPGDVRAEDW